MTTTEFFFLTAYFPSHSQKKTAANLITSNSSGNSIFGAGIILNTNLGNQA